jgi:major membrane immunogen (membrane-anchored lipoprotein)
MFILPSGVVKALGESGLNNTAVLSENPSYRKYFDLGYWRSVIAHELTHWMEDAIYGGKITKDNDRFKNKRGTLNLKKSRQVDKAGEFRSQDKIDQLELDKTVTGGIETEAVIAQLKQRKRTVGAEEWDAMSFKDLYKLDPILKHYIDKARNGTETGRFDRNKAGLSDKDFKAYIQRLIQKMDRVGILGASMRNPVGDIN